MLGLCPKPYDETQAALERRSNGPPQFYQASATIIWAARLEHLGVPRMDGNATCRIPCRRKPDYRFLLR